jgi:hypothetical protein
VFGTLKCGPRGLILCALIGRGERI